MPFGFIFAKLLRVLIKHWRVHNIKILAFFDAGLGAAYSLDEAYTHSCMEKTDLIHAGYVPNKLKSVWIPHQTLTWLEIQYDLLAGSVQATPDRMEKTVTVIQEILRDTFVPVSHLAAVVGRITSLYPAYGTLCTYALNIHRLSSLQMLTGAGWSP